MYEMFTAVAGTYGSGILNGLGFILKEREIRRTIADLPELPPHDVSDAFFSANFRPTPLQRPVALDTDIPQGYRIRAGM